MSIDVIGAFDAVYMKPWRCVYGTQSSLSYIPPQIVEKIKLYKDKQVKSWLVQSATGTKRKVSEIVKECNMSMNSVIKRTNLNLLPLGSYDVLIGMDWLESHHAIINC